MQNLARGQFNFSQSKAPRPASSATFAAVISRYVFLALDFWEFSKIFLHFYKFPIILKDKPDPAPRPVSRASSKKSYPSAPRSHAEQETNQSDVESEKTESEAENEVAPPSADVRSDESEVEAQVAQPVVAQPVESAQTVEPVVDAKPVKVVEESDESDSSDESSDDSSDDESEQPKV